MSGLKIKSRYKNTSNGYVKLLLSNGKIIEEHRFLFQETIGRELDFDEIVHHIDGNKSNNAIDNLELLSRSDHARHHSASARMINLTCAFCGSAFTREARQVETKRNNGQCDFYCNRSCAARHFGRGRRK